MNNFELCDSKESQNKLSDGQLNINSIGGLMSLDPRVGPFVNPADDVRKVPNGSPQLPELVINKGSVANYDGDPSNESATQKAIVAEANKDIGKELWHNWTPGHFPGGGADAMEGCAAAVSQVLNDCGAAKLFDPTDDNCDYLQKDLEKAGWTLTDKPQPGDVWIGRGGESEAHTGIIGENFILMDNHSSNGQWSKDSARYTYAWTNNVFLQPPDQAGRPAKEAG